MRVVCIYISHEQIQDNIGGRLHVAGQWAVVDKRGQALSPEKRKSGVLLGCLLVRDDVISSPVHPSTKFLLL